MSELHSTDSVEYRDLGFLGFPDYYVSNLGDVWSLRRKTGGSPKSINYEIAKEIREKYTNTELTFAAIGRLYNCPGETVRLILCGRIWKNPEWQLLKPTPMESGHLVVSLQNESGRTSFLVHRLVLLAFVGPCPEGMEACHYPDQSPTNNRIDNLRWDTRAGNEKDKIANGTSNRGERCGTAKLTEVEVLEIRERLSNGETQQSLADLYGVSRPTIGDIYWRRRWKHI